MKKIMKKMLIMSFIISMVVSPCSTIMAESTTMTAEQFKEMINNVEHVYYGSSGKSCAVGENIGSVTIEGCKTPNFTLDHLVLKNGSSIREPFPFTIRWVRGKSSETNDGFKKVNYSLYAYCGVSNYKLLTVDSVDIQKKSDTEVDIDGPQSRLLRNFLALGYYDNYNYMYNDKNKKADLHNLVINSDDKKKVKFKSLNKKLFIIKDNKYLFINTRKFKVKGGGKSKYKSTYYHGLGYLQVTIDGKEIGRILVCVFPERSAKNEFYPMCTNIKRVGKNKVKLNLFYPKKKYDVTNVKGLRINYSVEILNGKKKKLYENVGKSVTIDVQKSIEVNLQWSSNFYVDGIGYVKTYGIGGQNTFDLKKSVVKKMKLNKKYTQKSLKKNKIKIYL